MSGRHRRPKQSVSPLPMIGVGALLAAAFARHNPVPYTASESLISVQVLTPTPIRSDPREEVVAVALSKIGLPYVWGAKGEGDRFDCSGLTYFAWRQAGVNIGKSTYEQINAGHLVEGDPQPGDLIFEKSAWGWRGPGHVQLAISSTQVVEAPGRGLTVRVNHMPNSYIARRIS